MPYNTENRRPPVPTQIPAVVKVKQPVSAMIKACSEGNTWALSKLLVRGCNVDMLLDMDGTTPLMFLVSGKEVMSSDQNNSVRYLISQG
jgi:hypothetical protein